MDIKQKSYRKNDTVYKIGDPAKHIYFIKSGSFDIYDYIDIAQRID